jgi:ABC-2 type transport system permease protein
VTAPATTAAARPGTNPMNWGRVRTVARTDLRQLLGAKDFWVPMAGLGALFFVVIPTILLLMITRVESVQVVEQLSTTLEVLPQRAQDSLQGDSPETQAAYALAVFLFAPVAIVVPLTISTAVGAATIVGERERGTGEFLAHSPAAVKEIYLGKLLASLIPGLLTVMVGFGLYSVIVNLIVGPEVGGWFFPTGPWWVLMLWVLPPFLGLTLSLVLRLSAKVKSTAAAQQASGLVSLPVIMIAYTQSSGALYTGVGVSWAIGAIAWVAAIIALRRGMRAITRARLLGVADEM